MDEARKQDNQQTLKILEALKKASTDLYNIPIFTKADSETTIKAMLELDTEAETVISTDPRLFNLSQLLSNLKTLVQNLEKSQGYSLQALLRRQITHYKIYQIAKSIANETQSLIDRDRIQNLVKTLEESAFEDEKIKVLIEFESRVSEGFDRDFQDLILRAKIFSMLEKILCDSKHSKRFREQSGLVIAALVRFNKDVFVGLVLIGPTIRVLISMASMKSLQVLSSLIKLIKSPLVDEIESNSEIPKIITLLSSEDLSIRVMAMDCILEIGYFGRKEAIEAMFDDGLIEKLMELQRLEENGSDLVAIEGFDERESGGIETGQESETKMENRPFASCVARFAIQLEVGEGLSQREKRAFKLEILRRVREASVSDAEAATIVAEVLWGASP